MTTRRKKPLKKRKRQTHGVPPFLFEFRLQVARLRVQDGYPVKLMADQFGISEYSVYRWSKQYRLYGDQGLVGGQRKTCGSKVPASLKKSVVDLKKQDPARGARRISDIQKRFFLVGASPSTVQRALNEQGLEKAAVESVYKGAQAMRGRRIMGRRGRRQGHTLDYVRSCQGA